MSYGVAFFKDGKYEGRVAINAVITSRDDAIRIAERWVKAHGWKYDYRAVEFSDDGCLIWTERRTLMADGRPSPLDALLK